PEIKKAKKFGVEISSPIKLFFELCPTKNIIGVTGTKGKGTTSSLIYEIVGAGHCPVPVRDNPNIYIGGNIGIPVFSFLEKIKKNDWVVLELSSFQLEDLDKSPKIAVITNFSREHLKPADPNNPNHHKTLDDYFAAKFNIIRFQTKNNFAVINRDLKLKVACTRLTGENSFKGIFGANGKKIYFDKSNLKSQLLGEHNKKNIAAAIAVAKILKINKKFITRAITNFKGLGYRLEFVAEKDSINFYNDSFATIPESAVTALKSFNHPVILIAGGADKGNDFKKIAKEIKKKVKFLILFTGEGSVRLKNRLRKISFSDNKICMANNMSEAIKTALAKADSGDVVLLSPGCASFGVFKNYKERGRLFKEEVKKL
ncbi:UDP-N-acetylmuramoyl-L-alanine--D-glutamate ligase, partial [Candidatus Parcubacteria bacterium]|nr:UDP-N-acetylmuramoyl-L-alanine--D-glutamate ligase [Candidatus Parcubacteria bacterium]